MTPFESFLFSENLGVKSVRIKYPCDSGYAENVDQNNSEYGHFLCRECIVDTREKGNYFKLF